MAILMPKYIGADDDDTNIFSKAIQRPTVDDVLNSLPNMEWA